MMSQQNVDVVKRVYEAFDRRDWDAVFLDMHSDFQITTKRGPNAGTHQGRDGAQGFAEDYLAAFDGATAEPDRFLEAGDRVLVLVTRRGRPKGSEMEMVVRNGHLWTLREGRILSMESFPNPDEALEAAGLCE
jgi:ketosteroid isomerase-like protein